MVKFANPFQISDAPEHLISERKARHRHIYHTIALTITLTLFACYITPLICWIYYKNMQFSLSTIQAFNHYMMQLTTQTPFAPLINMVEDPWYVPGKLSVIIPGRDTPEARVILAFIITMGTAITIGMTRLITNPHRRMILKASAEWCDSKTLRMMEQRKQVGIQGGFIMALGNWLTGLRKNQRVQMIETLSALCIAPPGTGKTAGFVVPTVIEANNVSMVINDRKPEIFGMTGGWRSKVSDVIVIDWAKVDKHQIIIDKTTNKPIVDKDGIPLMEHTFYARFNPLSPKMMPPAGPDRDTYISTVAAVLIPKLTDNKDQYFSDKGRDALTGMIHAIVARVNDRPEDDPIRYQGMPVKWFGQEASLPMMTDWIAHSTFAATKSGESEHAPGSDEAQFNDLIPPDSQDPSGGDKLGAWFRNLCNEIDPETKPPEKSAGTTARGFGSLSQLVNMADKERSGVLGTMDQALQPFKNQSVQERTSASDFTPDDLRGTLQPDGTWRPMSIYVCVNQAEADAFATITALLYEVLSRALLTYKPGDYNHKTKRQLGPIPVCFVLDEFAKLPRIPAVLEGPDTGRSMSVSYLLACQSYGQIERIYGKADVDVIDSTTSVKIILPQNETATITRFQSMVGKVTIRRGVHSFSEGLSSTDSFKWNRSDTSEETDFLRVQDLTSMPQGQHIVLVQGFLTNPMKLKTDLYFKNPEMLAKVHVKGKGPVATTVTPKHITDSRTGLYDQEIRENEKKRAAIIEYARSVAIQNTAGIPLD